MEERRCKDVGSGKRRLELPRPGRASTLPVGIRQGTRKAVGIKRMAKNDRVPGFTGPR